MEKRIFINYEKNDLKHLKTAICKSDETKKTGTKPVFYMY